MDLFRVFDALNWVDNMRVAMDAVLETGKLCEDAICYTGDITDPARISSALRTWAASASRTQLGYWLKRLKNKPVCRSISTPMIPAAFLRRVYWRQLKLAQMQSMRQSIP